MFSTAPTSFLPISSGPWSPTWWSDWGGRRPQVLLQDYGRLMLVPLPGEGLAGGEPRLIDDSDAGRCFLEAVCVEVSDDGQWSTCRCWRR